MQAVFQNVKQSNWWRSFRLAWERWVDEDGDQRSGAFAYLVLLSIPPLIILVVTVGSLFVERETATALLVQSVNNYTPLTPAQEESVVATFHEMLEARGHISLAAIPLLVWGSLNFLRSLIRTTNRIWRSPTYNWWRLPLKSLGLLGIMASAALIGGLLLVLARLLRSWFTTDLEFPQWAFTLVFQLIPWLVLLYGFLMIFRLAPSRPTSFSEVWLGAFGVTVVIWLGERLFQFTLTNFTQLNALYGAMGGIVAFLLWLYVSSCVGVFGICFCAAQAEVRGKGTMLDAKAGGSHPSAEHVRKPPANSNPSGPPHERGGNRE